MPTGHSIDATGALANCAHDDATEMRVAQTGARVRPDDHPNRGGRGFALAEVQDNIPDKKRLWWTDATTKYATQVCTPTTARNCNPIGWNEDEDKSGVTKFGLLHHDIK